MSYLFNNAVVGGTFDRFHKGHEKLLSTAFSQSRHVTIGISTENLYKNKFLSETIEAYEIRQKNIEQFLLDNNFDKRSSIARIDDIYGTTLTEENIEAIFVTEENLHAAELINVKRAEQRFSPIKIFTVPFVHDRHGTPISSERIRKGEIDREGFVYLSLFHGILALPSSLRANLRKPYGNIYKDIEQIKFHLADAFMVISVGDIVTYTLAKEGTPAEINIIDFMTRRHEIKQDEKKLLENISLTAEIGNNEAGKIEKEPVNIINNAMSRFLEKGQTQTIIIRGEEDLLTLPAILLAPLQSYVVYGQYDEGAVLVEVTEQKKNEIRDLITQFST